MKLTRVRVQNLRCIENDGISVHNYTSLIGPNNAGKSSVLRAIELLLNQERPLQDEWRNGHESEPIIIEARFEDLQEWERNRPGVSGLVYNDAIQLKRTIQPLQDGGTRAKADSEYEAFKPEERIDGWSETYSKLDPGIKSLAKKEIDSINGSKFRTGSVKEQVRQLVRDHMPDKVHLGKADWTNEGVSISPALQQALPQAQMIPAVRDAEEDGKPGAKTSFGLLVKRILVPAIRATQEYEDLINAATRLDELLRASGNAQLPQIKELTESISNKLDDLIPASVRLGMNPPDAEKFVGSNTELSLHDGNTRTRIGLQGHGLQRALIFALLEVLAEQNAAVKVEEGDDACCRSTVLLFEEPELFIHPQLMRRLKANLERISKRRGWQVILSTHSPIMIDVASNPRALVIHRRMGSAEPPKLEQLDQDPFAADTERERERETLRAALVFHPTVCEAFFAKHAVLVEGDSEVAVLLHPKQPWKLVGIKEKAVRDTSIISCGGKWTIVPVARLLRAFKIPVRVIHDRDAKGRSVKELGELKGIDPYCANAKIDEAAGTENIHIVDDTLERILWTDAKGFTSPKEKPFRAWKQVEVLCEGKESLDHAPGFRDLLKFAFQTPGNCQGEQ